MTPQFPKPFRFFNSTEDSLVSIFVSVDRSGWIGGLHERSSLWWSAPQLFRPVPSSHSADGANM